MKTPRWLLLVGMLSTALYAADVKPVYTYETVAAYAEYHDRAVRFQNGPIRVFDESGWLKKYPNVLTLLNKNLGASKLVLTTDDHKAHIHIRMVSVLPAPYSSACATSSSILGTDNASIASNIIRIKLKNVCIKDDNPESLLMHELGHSLGFSTHAKQDDVMSIHDKIYESDIPMEVLQRFLKGLYTLEVGQAIPSNEKMPDPEGDLIYKRPKNNKIETAPPATETLNLKDRSYSYTEPTVHYKKIETMTDKGLTWTFEEERPPIEEKKKPNSPKYETIGPTGSSGQ